MRRYQATFCIFPSSDPIYTAIVILYSGDTRVTSTEAHRQVRCLNKLQILFIQILQSGIKFLDGKFIAQSGKHQAFAKEERQPTRLQLKSLPISNKTCCLANWRDINGLILKQMVHPFSQSAFQFTKILLWM